jgi:hypothetical protein
MEMCSKGVAQVSFHRNPRRRLPHRSFHRMLPSVTTPPYSKVVLRRHMIYSRPCSLHHVHDSVSSGHHSGVALPTVVLPVAP